MRLLAACNEAFQTTALCLAVGRGARDEPQHLAGAAHMLEHVLMSATRDGRPSLTERVHDIGGFANASTGLDIMLFYTQTHPDDADEAATRLYDAVFDATLTEAVVERERNAVLRELEQSAADPGDVVQDAFVARLFPEHPLGRPVGGSLSSVASLSLADLTAWYDTSIRSAQDRAALVVAGPRVPDSVLSWTTPAEPAESAPTVGNDTLPTVCADPEPRWPKEFCWLSVGARTPTGGLLDPPAYLILSRLMGDTHPSRLYRRLREEEGLAYTFLSWFRGFPEAGTWRVMAGTEGANGSRVLEVIKQTLTTLAEQGPTEDELAAAVRQAEMALLLGVESPSDLASTLALRTRAGSTAWTMEWATQSVRSVRPEEVRAAARQVLDDLVTVVRPEP